MTGFRAWRTLVAWDWAREMRRKRTLISMGLMGLVILFLFSFALPPTRAVLQETRSGILWVTFLLAGSIGVERAFRGQGDPRVLEGFLLAPMGRWSLYLARVTSTFLYVLVMEVFVVVLLLILFNQSLDAAGVLWLALAAGLTTLGFVEVGVLLSAMTWSLPGGEVLLRILLYPMLIPIFAVAVSITDGAFAGRAPALQLVGVIAAFDLVFLGAGLLLFEHVAREFDLKT